MKSTLLHIVIIFLLFYPEYSARSESQLNSETQGVSDSLQTNATADNTNAQITPVKQTKQDVLDQRIKELHQLQDRYNKSIEVIKLLYEKILGLDHHFTSMKTHQNIQKLSNPHTYPEFKKINKLMKDKMKRRFDVKMPVVLETNPYIASAYSLVSAIVGGGNNKEREEEFEDIACILDFTLKMSTDLKVIYFETEYLKDANAILKKECEGLFASCAKMIGYTPTLEKCRKSDNWEKVHELLRKYIERTEKDLSRKQQEDNTSKQEIDLKFSIHGVVGFIEKYNNFVSQGNRYYKKFDKILSIYESDSKCVKDLPENFNDLKREITETAQKFNIAYELSEIKGSRLKELLFGEVQ
ncbi:MAG: hypothetical protein AAF990_15120 [Bacteroidota bacterium]